MILKIKGDYPKKRQNKLRINQTNKKKIKGYLKNYYYHKLEWIMGFFFFFY